MEKSYGNTSENHLRNTASDETPDVPADIAARARFTCLPGTYAIRIKAACHCLILLGFFFVLIFGPLFYGAVETWQVAALAIVSAIMFAAWAVSTMVPGKPGRLAEAPVKISYFVYVLSVLFVILTVFQLVSFSETTLTALSPARAALNELSGIRGETTLSLVPQTTKLWLFRVIAYVIVFFVASHFFRNRKYAFYVLTLIVVFGYVLALYGLVQYLSNYSLPSLFDPKHSLSRAAGTYVNANHFAGYLEMCAPLALAILFIERVRRRDERTGLARRVINFLSEKLQDRKFLLPLTAIVVMSLAIVFSMSRMGIFSFVVSLVIFFLLVGRKHKKRRRAVIVIGIVAVLLALSLWLGLDPVLRRYSLIGGDAVGRAEAWKMTLDVTKDYPALGTGLGTFVHVSPNYQTLEVFYGHWAESHNDYLNLLSDTGIAGLLIGMLFLVAWYLYVFLLISKRQLRTYQISIAAGCVAGVTAIVFHSIADFNLQIPANAMYFATLLGLAIGVLRIDELPVSKSASEDADEKQRSISSAVSNISKKVVLCLVSAVLIVVYIPMVLGSSEAESWLECAKDRKEAQAKIEALNQSLSLERTYSEAYYRLGLLQYRERGNYQKARDYFRKAVFWAPCIGKYHYRLGMAYARLDKEALAEREFSLAKKLAPVHPPDLQYNIASYHLFRWRRTGDVRSLFKAIAEFKKTSEINPAYLSMALELVAKYLPSFQYRNLKNLVPDTPKHHYCFARFLESRKLWACAIKEYNEGLRLLSEKDPSYRGDAGLFLSLARLYAMAGNAGKSKEYYLKALSLTEDRGRIFRHVHADFAKAKLLNDGLGFLLSLRAKFPDDYELELEIARFRVSIGDYDAAEALLLKLAESRPSQDLYRHLYSLAMHRKEYSLAEVYAGEALRLNPSGAVYYALIARSRAANRDYEGAAESLRRALEIDPGNESYKKELQKLNERILFRKK